MFTVDVFPAANATTKEMYRIEIVIEAVNGGIWDSTDEVGDQLRYRLCRPTLEAAEVAAGELVAMGINAVVTVGSRGQDAPPRGLPQTKSFRHRIPAAAASGG